MEQPPHLAKLPALPGIELYYRYLNSGFRLPLAAGETIGGRLDRDMGDGFTPKLRLMARLDGEVVVGSDA